MKQLYSGLLAVLVVFLFANCTRAKEGEFDEDDAPDILVKGNKLEDLDVADQVLIVDGIVVNAVNNRQWEYKGGQFQLIENKTFKMKYDFKTERWNKVEL